MTLPKVAIIGQPNVGKSTLFNALLKKRMAIVDPTPGTTLDSIAAPLKYADCLVELIDSGGITTDKESARLVFAREVRRQIQAVIAKADIFIFVMDIRQGLTELDKEIARLVRTTGKPVIPVVNKADTMPLEAGRNEFFNLGFGEPLAVSALQKRGVDTLRETITETVKKLGLTSTAEETTPLKIAIIGKRNVGKSTLVNALAREERVIVSEIPGTTRDAIDVRFELDNEVFIAIDTAGLRRHQKPKDTIEIYSRFRTENAIKRADVVLFLIDARSKISEVDKKITEYLIRFGKPTVIVINKWDLVRPNTTPASYQEYLFKTLPNLRFAPLAFISAKTGFNLWATIKTAREIREQAAAKIPTTQLNQILKLIRDTHPPAARGGAFPRIYYGTQTDVNPPTLTVFVNNPALFTADYRKFLLNQLRDALVCSEVPLRLVIRKSGSRERS